MGKGRCKEENMEAYYKANSESLKKINELEEKLTETLRTVAERSKRVEGVVEGEDGRGSFGFRQGRNAESHR